MAATAAQRHPALVAVLILLALEGVVGAGELRQLKTMVVMTPVPIWITALFLRKLSRPNPILGGLVDLAE